MQSGISLPILLHDSELPDYISGLSRVRNRQNYWGVITKSEGVVSGSTVRMAGFKQADIDRGCKDGTRDGLTLAGERPRTAVMGSFAR